MQATNTNAKRIRARGKERESESERACTFSDAVVCAEACVQDVRRAEAERRGKVTNVSRGRADVRLAPGTNGYGPDCDGAGHSFDEWSAKVAPRPVLSLYPPSVQSESNEAPRAPHTQRHLGQRNSQEEHTDTRVHTPHVTIHINTHDAHSQRTHTSPPEPPLLPGDTHLRIHAPRGSARIIGRLRGRNTFAHDFTDTYTDITNNV